MRQEKEVTGEEGVFYFLVFAAGLAAVFVAGFLDSVFFGASFFPSVFFVIAISNVQLLSQVLILSRDVKTGLSGPIVCIERISGSPVILIIPEQLLGAFRNKSFLIRMNFS